jgi:hypothetical protein
MISANERESATEVRSEKSPKIAGKREKPGSVALGFWC